MTPLGPSFLEGFSLSKPLLMFPFVLALLFWLTMSAVFVYHWKRYAAKSRGILIAESLYFFLSASFIVLAATFYLVI